MASVTEINEYLNESGYSRKDMKKFFDDAAEVNWIIKQYKESGKKWNNLPIHQIKQLPGLKGRTEEQLRKKEEEKRVAEAKEKQRELDDKNYLENFESIMFQKIINHQNLTEKELSMVVSEYEEETTYGDDLRWTREADTIVKLCGRYFLISWQKGLTEMQENIFSNQPYEVERNEKVVVVVEWVRKE